MHSLLCVNSGLERGCEDNNILDKNAKNSRLFILLHSKRAFLVLFLTLVFVPAVAGEYTSITLSKLRVQIILRWISPGVGMVYKYA